jgi:hypothetical protein
MPMVETLKLHRIAPADLVGLGVALAVGALLRFAYPGVIDWSKDHSDMATLALDLAEGVRFPTIGPPSSGGVPHSPFFIYLPALAYLLTTDPVVMTACIAAFNLAGLALVWFLGHRYLGPRVAFIAAMAYAVNPWVVGFSRTIWSGDHRAPLFVAAVACGLLGFVEGKRWAQILFGPTFIAAVQVHYAGWTLAPVGLWLVLAGRRMSRTTLAISIALTTAVLVPFAVGLLQHFSQASHAVASISPQVPGLSLRALIRPLGQFAWVTAGVGYEQYAAREYAQELAARVKWFLPLWWMQGGLACIGWLVMWRQPRILSVTLALWTVTTVGAFSLPILGVFPHYFSSVIPGVCLVIGLGADWVMSSLATRSAISLPLAWALVACIWASQASYVLMLRTFVDRVFTPTQFGFGTPVRYLKEVARELTPYKSVVFVVEDDWLESSRTGSSVFKAFLRHSASCMADVHRGSNTAVVPPAPFALVWSPRVPSDGFLEQAYGAMAWKTFPLRRGEGQYRVAVVDSNRENGQRLPIRQPPDAGPLRPIAYVIQPDGIVLEWLVVTSPVSESNYVVTLRDEAGSVVWSRTVLVPELADACRGTEIISKLQVPTPQGSQFDLDVQRAGGIPR